MTRRSSGTVLNEEKMWSEDTFLLTGKLNAMHNSLGIARGAKDSNPRFCKRSIGAQDRNAGVSHECRH